LLEVTNLLRLSSWVAVGSQALPPTVLCSHFLPMKIRLIVVAALLLLAQGLSAQVKKEALAQEYLRRGEFAKAVVLYQELREQQPESEIFYRYFYECQMALKAFDDLEKELRRLIRKQPLQLGYRVDLGAMYRQKGQADQAKIQFEGAVEQLAADRSQIVQLSNAFTAIDEYDYAIRALESGTKLLKGQAQPFDYELANLYYRKGDMQAMIGAFLDYLQADERNMPTVQASLQRNLTEQSQYEELQNQVYTRIQRQPNDERWTELLIWNFIQNKDFEAAFQQVRAQDRRLQEGGHRVYEFAELAQSEKAWTAAIHAYDYLVSKGREGIYYFNSRNGLIECRQEKLMAGFDYTEADIRGLSADYQQFLRDYGRRDARSAEAWRSRARLHALYLHQMDSAIAWVEQTLTWPGLRPAELAEAKLDLGDYLLMDGDIWDASLLYSQVDKTMKDEPLGERARFLNARLSYFQGDFTWAKAQLEVLKASTSELVANDALNLDVFLSSNMGLDTSSAPMEQYSRADLLVFQNRLSEADAILDSMKALTPGHALADDVLWLRSTLARKTNDVDKAVSLLETLVAGFSHDILADDALFTLAELYEERFGNKEKAMEYYQLILVDHKDSVFVVEARKRFRALRGDNLN